MYRTVERHRHLLDFALTSLLRRPAKNLSLMGVFTLVVFLCASVLFLSGSLRKEAALLLADAPEIVVQRSITGRYAPIPLSYADTIRRIRGVVEVTPRLWGYYYDQFFKANYTLLVQGNRRMMPGEIAIGQAISRQRKVYEGDTVMLRGADGVHMPFQVRSLLPAGAELVSADLILMNEEDFRQISGLERGVATDLTVRARNPNEFSTIAGKIATAFPDARPIIRNEILRTYEAVFGWRSGIAIFMLTTVSLAFLIFAWDKSTGLSAEERREIGILKAVGWDTSDILLMKFWEGLCISVAALLLGILLAYLHVFVAQAPLFTPLLRGWSTLYPQMELAPHLDFDTLSILACLTVIPYTVATIVPSWRAATIDPDAVMR